MKKLRNISGVTLIEILLGIVISVIMMGAMLTSYNVVNNSYSQVTDKAKISNQGKVVLGMIMAELETQVLNIMVILWKLQMNMFQFNY